MRASLVPSHQVLVQDVLGKNSPRPKARYRAIRKWLIRGTRLRNADELEEYTYLVAGFGRRILDKTLCASNGPSYSRIAKIRIGNVSARSLGRALQLVNILRDFPPPILPMEDRTCRWMTHTG